MRTVVELPTFQKQATRLWSEDEHAAFIDWIAANPDAGDIVPGAQGIRKVRWARAGDLLQPNSATTGMAAGDLR